MVLPMPKAPSKPGSKPASAPRPFEKGKKIPVRDLIRGAKKPVAIPGTGGQRMWPKQHQELVRRYLPYKQVGTELSEMEAKTILRKMRKKEGGGMPSRERRVLEQDFGLKGKY